MVVRITADRIIVRRRRHRRRAITQNLIITIVDGDINSKSALQEKSAAALFC